MKITNDNNHAFSSFFAAAKHSPCKDSAGLQARSESLKELLEVVLGAQSDDKTGLANIRTAEHRTKQAVYAKTITNTGRFTLALAKLAKETWQNQQQLPAPKNEVACQNHQQAPSQQDKDKWQNYQQVSVQQDEDKWQTYQQVPVQHDEDKWQTLQPVAAGQDEDVARDERHSELGQEERSSQEYPTISDQSDENLWCEYPQQPNQCKVPVSKNPPTQKNQIADPINPKKGGCLRAEPTKKKNSNQKAVIKKLLQAEKQFRQQQLSEKLAIKFDPAASMKEPAQKMPVQVESIIDSDGWTTMVMQQITEDVSTPCSSKIFNLTEEEVDEIFSRMIIGKKELGKCSKKKLRKQKRSSKLGKISVDNITSKTGHVGLITDIGKFLLDPEAVYAFERILQNDKSTGTLKRLSQDHSKLIDSLQTKIGKEPGVIGSIVMGHDGTVISSSIPASLIGEEIAAWSFSAHVNSNIACQLLSAEALHDLVMTGDGKDLIISDFGGFLLVTLTDQHNPGDIARLVEKFDHMRN